MEDVNKKTMLIIVFGIITIMSIIIFSFFMANMSETEEDNDFKKRSYMSSETTVENKDAEEKESAEFTYDFERIKFLDICVDSLTECDTLIGTISEKEETKMLGLKYMASSFSLIIDEKEIYKKESEKEIIEFISFENKYLIIMFKTSDEIKNFVMIDNEGNEVLKDDYVLSNVEIKENSLIYKTLNCDLKDNYLYNASIKIINKKPKIVLIDKSEETSKIVCE